jgi:hypothetical protein
MCKEMLVILVDHVMDKKRIIGKIKGRRGGEAQGVVDPPKIEVDILEVDILEVVILEVDILEVDILEVDILEVDILEVDIFES